MAGLNRFTNQRTVALEQNVARRINRMSPDAIAWAVLT